MTRTPLVSTLVLALASLTWAAAPYNRTCPEQDRNVLAVASIRAGAAERCDCVGAASHRDYVRCAAREVKFLARVRRQPRACRRVALAFERQSTCGRADAVVCCRPGAEAALAAVSSTEGCAARGGTACGRCAPGGGAVCAHSLYDACAPDATCVDSAAGGAPAAVHPHLMPSTELVFGWIADIVAQGIRRPGYPADDWTERWAFERFADLGLEDVHFDPIDVPRWDPQRCALRVWPQGRPAERRELPCFSLPYSKPTTGLIGPLARLAAGDVDGRLAVIEAEFLRLPMSVELLFASDSYDPSGEFATHIHTLPFAGGLNQVMDPAIAAGATGFIGILQNMPWESDQYYVPYDAEKRPIPGVWLSPANGAQLESWLANEALEGEIVSEAAIVPAVSHNVLAALPGASSEWVIIGSHHDGPWASAVEDASGTAMVMAQAFYWAQVPASERPHNLLFLLNGGHMAGGAGLKAFVERNRNRLDQVVLELHLEHVAREARGENGRLVPTDKPEVRWWFTSRIPALQAAVKQALVREQLERSLIMMPDGFPPGSPAPPTDGAFFHPAGVPIVNLLAAPMYLFDAGDTLAMIHEPSLLPVTRATARLVAWTRGRTAAGMRAAVMPPP